MSPCIFCRIAAGESPARIEYQDKDLIIFHDINPQAPVHLLIIPRRHIASLQELKAEDEELMGHLLYSAARQAEKMGLPEKGYRLVLNNGRWAGQAVFHIHLHLLAGRPMHWPPG